MTKYEDIIMKLMDTVDSTSQNQDAILTNHCFFQSKTYSQSLDVVQLLQDVSTVNCCSCQRRNRNRWYQRRNQKAVVTGVEMFRKQLTKVLQGITLVLLLRGIQRDEIERGQVIAKPGSINPHTKFKGEVYILTKEEGGRHSPFFNNYRPQFYFRTTDVTGSIELPAGTEMVMPGDNVTIDVELIHPIAVEQGTTFSIREGGRTVGSGMVTEIEA